VEADVNILSILFWKIPKLFLMLSSGVIMWCYHVMLSCGMITHPIFIIPHMITPVPT
jgi:hypothetical protein